MVETLQELKGEPESFDDDSNIATSKKDTDSPESDKGTKRPRRKRQKKDKDEKDHVKIGVTLPKHLVKQMKLIAVEEDETISGWLEKLLNRSIGKRLSKKEKD